MMPQKKKKKKSGKERGKRRILVGSSSSLFFSGGRSQSEKTEAQPKGRIRVWKSKGKPLDERRERIISESHKSSLLNPPTGRPRQLSFLIVIEVWIYSII